MKDIQYIKTIINLYIINRSLPYRLGLVECYLWCSHSDLSLLRNSLYAYTGRHNTHTIFILVRTYRYDNGDEANNR